MFDQDEEDAENVRSAHFKKPAGKVQGFEKLELDQSSCCDNKEGITFGKGQASW